MSDAHLKDRVVAAIGDLYDVEHEIGRGGSAVVYRAVDVRLRRAVAVKVLPPELAYRDEVRSRFVREAQMSAQLSHPNIVPIYSVDERGGLVFFVMCLVEGESLAGRLRTEARPPVAFVRRVLREVADALAYAHSRGVIHRDIKPDNILLDRESGRAMVTDFGIARALEAGTRLTVTGIAVGTPAYMSPEQALGERETDARSDVYSLGVVGYQMLAGELPFRATNTPAMLMKHISETPAALAARRPDVPAALRHAIERALAKKPEARWSDARAFRDAVAADAPAPPAAALVPQPAAPAARLPMAARPPLPAPAGGDPFGGAPAGATPLPPFPPFPPSGDREARELWRRQQRVWREQVRAGHREAELARREAHEEPGRRPAEARAAKPLDRQLVSFRRHLFANSVFVSFLGVINIASGPFPWVVFPAMGIFGTLRSRWIPLREAGVSWGDVFRGRLPAHLGGQDPALRRMESRARAEEARMEIKRARMVAHWRDYGALERRANRFRIGAYTTLGAGAASLLSFGIGGSFNLDALIPVFALSSMTSVTAGVYTAAVGRRLRKAGVRLRSLLHEDWRARLKAADPRPRADLLAEAVAALAPPEVLAGPHGDMVRRAAADRAEIQEVFARMSPADRVLLPDVTSTVSGLVERVAMLAQALHRLDEDRPAAMLAALEERLALAEREPLDTPDRERRHGLLQRQRATLQDLVQRRATLAGQLESAALVLQSVRLDLVKLRSAGVQAALDDVTNATQEARALSREIGHVLEAAAEVRAL